MPKVEKEKGKQNGWYKLIGEKRKNKRLVEKPMAKNMAIDAKCGKFRSRNGKMVKGYMSHR